MFNRHPPVKSVRNQIIQNNNKKYSMTWNRIKVFNSSNYLINIIS